MTEKELAQYLKVSTVYLYKCRKNGMPYIRLSRNCIRYILEDVLIWLNNSNSLGSEC